MKKPYSVITFFLLMISWLFTQTGCVKEDETPVDGDGTTYTTVVIGTQTWLLENLKTTRFNDGTSIPLVTEDGQWINLKAPGFCWYNHNEQTYRHLYGGLYNWYAINTGKLCPKGWHVPTEKEWIKLETQLGMNAAEASQLGWRGADKSIGGMLKSTSGQWTQPNVEASNSSGFTGEPGGCRTMNSDFNYINGYGYWWCAVQVDDEFGNMRSLSSELTTVFKSHYPKTYGMSVRCVKD